MASPPISQYSLEMRTIFYVAIGKALNDRYAVNKELILAEERKQKTALVRFGAKCGEAWMPFMIWQTAASVGWMLRGVDRHRLCAEQLCWYRGRTVPILPKGMVARHLSKSEKNSGNGIDIDLKPIQNQFTGRASAMDAYKT